MFRFARVFTILSFTLSLPGPGGPLQAQTPASTFELKFRIRDFPFYDETNRILIAGRIRKLRLDPSNLTIRIHQGIVSVTLRNSNPRVAELVKNVLLVKSTFELRLCATSPAHGEMTFPTREEALEAAGSDRPGTRQIRPHVNHYQMNGPVEPGMVKAWRVLQDENFFDPLTVTDVSIQRNENRETFSVRYSMNPEGNKLLEQVTTTAASTAIPIAAVFNDRILAILKCAEPLRNKGVLIQAELPKLDAVQLAAMLGERPFAFSLEFISSQPVGAPAARP